jgi:adenosylmethionine-8-amino-7-oxononanoate aminotransferase
MGAAPAVPGYFKAMKEVCERHGALFIMDEVLCGMGRTGTLHAWEQENVVPDLQTIAKGLGAGYASIGALLVNTHVTDVLKAGTATFSHSQTYQGHPLACAAALEVQNIIREENMLDNVRRQGAKLGSLLKARVGGHPNVGNVRGRGLLWGVSLLMHPVVSGVTLICCLRSSNLCKAMAAKNHFRGPQRCQPRSTPWHCMNHTASASWQPAGP